MTTVFLSEKQCYACGSKSQYPFVDLTLNIIGSRDLDGRPAMIHRSSVYLWVQRCVECGYCAPEISQGKSEELPIINHPKYREQLINSQYPETANSFLCHSIIMEYTKLYADAGWASVFAAWVCDDNGYEQSACDCRKKAIDLFHVATKHKQGFAESPAEGQLYLIDLHRRSLNFKQANEICDLELKKTNPEKIVDLLYLEKQLIEKKDSACYNDSDIGDSDFETI